MARIRSVHPGLWTDEAFVSVSITARLLAIGIWNECDDQGAFEWKPLQLKMRLLPADNADVESLLEELRSAGLLQPYTVGDRRYGAVRNFGKFQRPKKPNSVHPMPAEMKTYAKSERQYSEPGDDEAPSVGNHYPPSSEPIPHRFPTGGGIPPQMEDGGGRMEERKEEERALCALPHTRAADADGGVDLLGHPPTAAAAQKPQSTKAKRQTPATTIDPEWKPDADDIDVASRKGIANVPGEAEQFVNYHLAKGTRSQSWAASWRTWCLHDVKYRQERRARVTGAPRTITPDGQPVMSGMLACVQRMYDQPEQDERDDAA
jgi:hypothetical protein